MTGETLVTGEDELGADAVARVEAIVLGGAVAELFEHAASAPTSTTAVIALKTCLFMGPSYTPSNRHVTHILVASIERLA